MKKVFVLAAALALVAAPALAGISTTKHNLASNSGNTVKGDSNEICVYCHTPHGGALVNPAPLWNRTTVNATKVYAGVDLDVTLDIASYNTTDLPLCLSCHDGTSVTSALKNPPNSTGAVTVTGTMDKNAALGTDLSNDHPIGFSYDAAVTDLEIQSLAYATGRGVQFFNPTVGLQNEMWCSSCHDVHNDTKGTPFLNTTNAGSYLCLSCHNK